MKHTAAELLARLPAKRRAFVERSLVHRNASLAYTEAYGKTGRTAESNGSRLLRKAEVRAAIAAASTEIAAKAGVDAERVERELAHVAFSNINDYEIDALGNVKLADGAPRDAMRAVSSIKRRVESDKDGKTVVSTELRLWDKPVALGMLGKHLPGFFPNEPQKHEVEFSYAKIVAAAAARRAQRKVEVK